MIKTIRMAITHQGIKASATSGDMDETIRTSELSSFMSTDDCTLLITTNGHGCINHPNINVVFQFDIPKQTSTYYYRATRAAENGNGNTQKIFFLMNFVGYGLMYSRSSQCIYFRIIISIGQHSRFDATEHTC